VTQFPVRTHHEKPLAGHALACRPFFCKNTQKTTAGRPPLCSPRYRDLKPRKSSPPPRNEQNIFRIPKGTYVLILELKTFYRLSVGKLGTFDFPTGWYAYAGHAFGPGGLAARIGHHLRGTGRPHWHMDYLNSKGCIREVWYGIGQWFDEHRWTACLRAMPGAGMVAPGFGSSDCSCETHLVHFPRRPNVNRFKRRQPATAGEIRPPIYRLPIDPPLQGSQGRHADRVAVLR